MTPVRLPARIFESNLHSLLTTLARADATKEPVHLDFSRVEFWIPAGIVATCAMLSRWREQGRDWSLAHLEKCRALQHLQNADFFERAGISLPKKLHPTESASLVEIREILPGSVRLNDDVATRLAIQIAGTTDRLDDVLRFSEYAAGEILSNCRQHAMKPGFAAAHYLASTQTARLAVADYGIGVRESFRSTGSVDYDEQMSDAEVLELAMTPWKSSKTHLAALPYGRSSNKGIGLKMIRHMVVNSFGEFLLASGRAWIRYRPGITIRGILGHGASIPGVLVAVRFDRSNMVDFTAVMAQAQAAVGLTSEETDGIFP
jgi:hypothetical protein